MLFLQCSQTVSLSKGASSIAAGVAPHDVAVGDAAGVVWLYDLRRTDAPLWRLPCDGREPVTCISWTLGRAPTASGATQATLPAASGAPASKPLAATLSSKLPEAPQTGAVRPPSTADGAAPRAAIARAAAGGDGGPARTSSAERPSDGGGSHSDKLPGRPVTAPSNNGAARPPAPPAPSIFAASAAGGLVGTSTSPPVPPQPDLAMAARGHERSHSVPESFTAPPAAAPRARANGSRGTSASPVNIDPDELQSYIREAVSSALAGHAATPAMPALHTQQIKDYVDAAVAREVSALRQDMRQDIAGLRTDVQGWMMKQNNDIMKQAQLAQDDAYELHAGVMDGLSALSASVQQVHAKLEEDEETRRNLGRWA